MTDQLQCLRIVFWWADYKWAKNIKALSIHKTFLTDINQDTAFSKEQCTTLSITVIATYYELALIHLPWICHVLMLECTHIFCSKHIFWKKKVEETTACIITMDDIINHVYNGAVTLSVSNIKQHLNPFGVFFCY